MIKIKDFMSKNLLICRKNELVITAAKKLENTSHDCILVVEKRKPIGVLTERDIISFFIHSRKKKARLMDIMRSPVITIESDKTLKDAIEVMKKMGLKQIAVMQNNKLVGLVTEDDVIRGMIRSEANLTKKLISGKIKNQTYAKKQQNLFQELQEIRKSRKQLSTGSRALDKFLGGGYPYNKNILFYGMPGAGKSVFAYSFVTQGLKDGDICIYCYSTETEEEIKDGLAFTGLENIDEYIKKKQLILLKLKDSEDSRISNISSDMTTRHLFNIKETVKAATTRNKKNKDINIRFVFNIFLSIIMSCDAKTIYFFLSDLTNYLKKEEVTSLFLLQKGLEFNPVLTAIEEIMNIVIELDIQDEGIKTSRILRVRKADSAKMSLSAIKFKFKKGEGFVSV